MEKYHIHTIIERLHTLFIVAQNNIILLVQKEVYTIGTFLIIFFFFNIVF